MTARPPIRCAGHTMGIDCWEIVGPGTFFCGSSDPASPSGCWAAYYERVDAMLADRERRTAEAARMVEVFSEVRRVLRKDGSLWLNLGDSYAMGGNGSRDPKRWPKQSRNDHQVQHAKNRGGLANKQLVGAPWRVALALQADGWWLRCDVVWSKPCPMPESVADRPTRSHEYLFLLSRAPSYYYDADAIRQPLAAKTLTTFGTTRRSKGNDALGLVRADNWSRDVPIRLPRPQSHDDPNPAGANVRSVWTIASKPYPEAHFATFPEALVQPCILAGSRPGDTVLDPFAGSGTVGVVAKAFGREFIGIELNPEYVAMAERRIAGAAIRGHGMTQADAQAILVVVAVSGGVAITLLVWWWLARLNGR